MLSLQQRNGYVGIEPRRCELALAALSLPSRLDPLPSPTASPPPMIQYGPAIKANWERVPFPPPNP